MSRAAAGVQFHIATQLTAGANRRSRSRPRLEEFAPHFPGNASLQPASSERLYGLKRIGPPIRRFARGAAGLRLAMAFHSFYSTPW